MSGGRYRPRALPDVEAIQWDDNWAEVSRWAYGSLVEATEEDYDSSRYWVLPDGCGGLSALLHGNEVMVSRGEWLLRDAIGVSVWTEEEFGIAYEEAPA